MYRSEYLYKNIDLLIKDEEVFPICVPSYSRPNASFLKYCKNLPIHLFIRSEEYELYKKYENDCTILLLDNVNDVGETRREIVNWAIENNVDDIFMVDDDVTSVHFNIPGDSSNSDKQFMKSWYTINDVPWTAELKFFKMWLWMLTLCDDKVTMSAPGQRSDWWNIRYKDEPITYNRGTPIQCIHLNISNLKNTGINYNSTKIDGAEDYAIIYRIMKSGLYTTLFTDLAYCVPSIGSGEGGCNKTESKDLNERYDLFIERFMSNVLDEEDKYRVSIKTSKGGVKSIKFQWNQWKIPERKFWGI